MRFIITLLLISFHFLSYSQKSPSLKEVDTKVQDIDLKLNKFSKQHSLGSTFQFAGLLLATTGLVMNYNHTPQIGKVPPGHLLVALGVITASTGVFISLNSYKHLYSDLIQ